MAAALLKGIYSSRCQLGPIAECSVFVIQSSCYSCGPTPLKSTSLAALKRGTGGRCSFNGTVATIFGCSGFMGRYIANRLGKLGTQLIFPYRGDGYDVLPLRLTGDLGQTLFLEFDLNDLESIDKAVRYSNVVINLVGRQWETKNFKFDDVHVEGARRIARAAKKAGVDKFIHLSALNASASPEGHILKAGSQFLRSKFCGECAVREEFPEATIIRPSDVYGPEDSFVRFYGSTPRNISKRVPMYKKGEHTIKQPVAVADVAAAIVAITNNPDAKGKIYQAVGPKRYKLSELIDWMYKLMRKGEHWGYKRSDIFWEPMFAVRILLFSLLPGRPIGGLFWDRFEREAVTDCIDPKLPTLEDLGICLTHIEDQMPWELKPYKAYLYYDEKLGDFPEPAPPPTV